MNDYIRKAVELADGFSETSWSFRVVELPEPYPTRAVFTPNYNPQPWFLDALAAQLVRQVDELILYHVRIEPTGTFIDHEGTGERVSDCCLAGGRTMNTIKAIIDSGVLK